MSASPMDPEPTAALAAVRETRRGLASGRAGGFSTTALQGAFAAIISGCIAANAAPFPFVLVIIGALVLLMSVMVSTIRRKSRVHVNGWFRRPGRLVVVGITAVYLLATLVSLWIQRERGIWWAPLAGGALAFPFLFQGYRLWSQVYRRDLEKGS